MNSSRTFGSCLGSLHFAIWAIQDGDSGGGGAADQAGEQVRDPGQGGCHCCHCFHFSPSICHELLGLDVMICVYWMLSFSPVFPRVVGEVKWKGKFLLGWDKTRSWGGGWERNSGELTPPPKKWRKLGFMGDGLAWEEGSGVAWGKVAGGEGPGGS